MQDYDNLQSFLEHVALATSIDQSGREQKLIEAMHATKGLEFDVVFLRWEEGLFPHQKSLEEKGDFALEEKVIYVGITRAKRATLNEKGLSWRLDGCFTFKIY